MKQQKITKCPRTGKLKVVYVDLGPGKAVAGHGRPTLSPHGIGGGRMSTSIGAARAR